MPDPIEPGPGAPMDPLDAVAVRVLGSLIEKEITTPDNYPLTLNSLVAACSQTSNRDPVLALDEATVAGALAELAGRGFAREVHRSDSRAKRWRQAFSEALSLHPAEVAVMGVLMLRGPQTPAEIRTRAARLFAFRDVPHVEVTLESLATLSQPLVAQLPRRPGQKEVRYTHLLAGAPEAEREERAAGPRPEFAAAGLSGVTPGGAPWRPGPGLSADSAAAAGIGALRDDVESLRAEVAQLRAQLEEVRRELGMDGAY